MILGVDPGTYVGLCGLSLDGRVIGLLSLKNPGLTGIVETVREWGIPSLIAFDKKIPNDTVLQLASMFNTPIYLPDHDLKEEEKRLLSSRYHPKNAHERDACASAVRAYRHYRNKLRHIDSLVKEYDLTDAEVDRVKHMVISGVRLTEAVLIVSMDRELREVRHLAEERRSLVRDQQPINRLIKRVDDLRSRLDDLVHENLELRKRINHLEAENNRLNWMLKSYRKSVDYEVKRDSTVRLLRHRLDKLTEELQKLKEKRCDQTGSEPREPKGKTGSEDRVIRSEDPSVSSEKDLKTLLEDIISEYREKRRKEYEGGV